MEAWVESLAFMVADSSVIRHSMCSRLQSLGFASPVHLGSYSVDVIVTMWGNSQAGSQAHLSENPIALVLLRGWCKAAASQLEAATDAFSSQPRLALTNDQVGPDLSSIMAEFTRTMRKAVSGKERTEDSRRNRADGFESQDSEFEAGEFNLKKALDRCSLGKSAASVIPVTWFRPETPLPAAEAFLSLKISRPSFRRKARCRRMEPRMGWRSLAHRST